MQPLIMKTDSPEGQPILAPGELGTQNLLESEDHLGVVSQIEDDYPSLLEKMWGGGPIDDLTVDGGTIRRDGARHSGGGVGADELEDQNVIVEDREVSGRSGKKRNHFLVADVYRYAVGEQDFGQIGQIEGGVGGRC